MSKREMPDGDELRVEPGGRYRTSAQQGCYGCGSREWYGVVRERDGHRRLRCVGCGRLRGFMWQGLTFIKDAA